MPAGRQQRGAAGRGPVGEPRTDHRPEPAGAVRPARLAGVPGAGRRRATRSRVVCPKGDGDPAFQVIDTVELYKYKPYAPGGSKLSFIAEYVYSFVATAWTTAQGPAARQVQGPAGLQPAGHLLADRQAAAGPGRHPVRVRPPRPVPRALPVTLPRGPEPALPGAARPRAHHAPDRRPRHLDQRLLPRHRHPPQRQGAGRRDRRPHRTRPRPAAPRPGRPGPAPRAEVPGGLHRRDGAPGRGGHRGAGRRHPGPPAAPRGHRIHPDRLAATASPSWSRCGTSWTWAATWSSPAGSPTSWWPGSCRPPTWACRPTPRTRSTTCPR